MTTLTPKQLRDLQIKSMMNRTLNADSIMSKDAVKSAMNITSNNDPKYMDQVDEILNTVGRKVADEVFEEAKAIIEEQRLAYELAVAKGEIEPFDRSKYYEDHEDEVIPKENYDEINDRFI